MYGIDFGAKLAGTTVVAFLSENRETVHFATSFKKQDADKFLIDFFNGRPPGKIFIDAPLSLPSVYSRQDSDMRTGKPDYFYRKCDRELGAMSPLFLGGLTARAISLAADLRDMGHSVVETYPAGLAQLLGLKDFGYKSDRSDFQSCIDYLYATIGFQMPMLSGKIITWHQFDALLALCSGLRHEMRLASSKGSSSEGLILI